MRPLRYEAEVGGGKLMEKRSAGLEHAEEAWDEWEIHFLILVSLSLQVFLCLTADLRRRSASRVLSTLLWLAYLSADTVAVFVLGHLAVHAQGPSHELMLFWAPFVLVHMGGQNSITAFSKQDNELWTRHLLSLVTQTVVTGYVVSKSSWPDTRLRAAMVLMFLCGFLKYSGRTYCLYLGSPTSLRASSMDSLWNTIKALRRVPAGYRTTLSESIKERFEEMFLADKFREFIKNEEPSPALLVDDIMLLDAPVDVWSLIALAEELPDMLKEKAIPDRCIAYQYVAVSLGESYQYLYTKASLVGILHWVLSKIPRGRLSWALVQILTILTYTLFHCISTTIALVLFACAQKEGHHSKADITVSYILLVGAIVLDLLPTFMSIVSYARKPFRPRSVVECVEISYFNCIQPAGWRTLKRWSEELPQYSMNRRYSTGVEDYHGCMPLPFIRKCILNCKPIGVWCAKFFDLTHTPVTDDLKLVVLDRLLLLQTRREEWDFASFRGERAIGKWMGSRHQVQEPAESRSGYDALHKSLSSKLEFPASVLIWHIATEICYFSEDNGHDIETTMAMTMKKKMMSRELSQYIMYLVFKCDVMLTSNSRLLHKKTHEELAKYFQRVHQNEKQTVIVTFEAMKKKAVEEQATNKDDAATSSESGIQVRIQRTMEALYSPVLPLARDMAQELIDIHDKAHRWALISEVWLEMLFYTAPRCGASFHYEHLSTGGEFITHVLLLMRLLGPFMPKPGA